MSHISPAVSKTIVEQSEPKRVLRAHKLTVLVVDFDDIGADGVGLAIENARYPNRCIYPTIMAADSRDIGDPEDFDFHPLNGPGRRDEFERLFGKS